MTESASGASLKKKMGAVIKTLQTAGVDTENYNIQVDADLYKQFNEVKKKRTRNKRYSEQYTTNVKEQILRQEEILRKFQACQGVDEDWVNSRLSNVDMEKFSQMLTGDFYDDATMNSMVCLSRSAFLANSSSLSANDRIRSWIRDLKQMGTESLTGFAMVGNVGSGINEQHNAKSAFIVKAVRDSERGSELIHEVFCGMMALNRLRKLVPNFSYIYGFIKCSAPVGSIPTDKDPKGKRINTFCNTMGEGNDVVQAIYENISPAKDFGTVIKTCSSEDYMRYYLATMMGLHVAERECDFTHYDLHQENLLIRECTDTRYLENGGGEFYIKYTLDLISTGETLTFYVLSPGGIPTIIDYGRSHVKVDGRNYGMAGDDSYLYIRQNVYRDRCNPMYDAFKLLGMSLAAAYHEGNFKVVTEISPLLRRFHVADFDITKITGYSDLSVGYMMPLDTTITDMEEYILYLIQYSEAMGWNVVTTNPPEGAFILTAVSDRLEIDVLRDIGLDDRLVAVPQPQTFLELYDVLTKQALKIDGFRGSIVEGVSDKTRKYFQAKVKEETALYQQVRNDFIRVDENGSRQLDIAYDFVLRRMKEVCEAFIDVNLYEYKNLGEDIENFVDIIPNIENVIEILSTPSDIDLYFNNKTLAQCKIYIARIAAFAEMRDTMSTIDHALEYLNKVYEKSSAHEDGNTYVIIDKLHKYVHNFVEDLRPISQKYYDSLLNFIEVFTPPEEGTPNYAKRLAKYQKMKDDTEYSESEQYGWYFSTVITVPSLFRS
jgi:hypothetical protein